MGKVKKEKQPESRTKKIVNIVVMAIEVLIIIACITLSIMVIIGAKSTTEELGSGLNMTVVLTESMNGSVEKSDYSEASHPIGSFAAGDLLFIKSMSTNEDYSTLKVGDVVTYVGNVAGTSQLITHRIVKIEENEATGGYVFYTLGDAERATVSYYTPEQQEEDNIQRSKKYYSENIQGVVVAKVSKVGNVIAWFQDSTHFLWSVVVPLALLLVYNVYELIRMIMAARIKKIEQKSKEELESIKLSMAQSAAQTVDGSIEEEIKRKAIEEYLAKMAAQSAAAANVEDKPADAVVTKSEEIDEKKEE